MTLFSLNFRPQSTTNKFSFPCVYVCASILPSFFFCSLIKMISFLQEIKEYKQKIFFKKCTCCFAIAAGWRKERCRSKKCEKAIER